MNRRLLQKVLDNLSQEKPDISYVRGILETIIESLPEDKMIPLFTGGTGTPNVFVSTNTVGSSYPDPIQSTNISDGVESLELGVKAKIANIQKADIS